MTRNMQVFAETMLNYISSGIIDRAEWESGKDRPNYRFVVQDVDGLFEELHDKASHC